MRCCNKNRFLNQQTYINTLCQGKQPPPPRQALPNCHHINFCNGPSAKACFYTDCNGSHAHIEFNLSNYKKK